MKSLSLSSFVFQFYSGFWLGVCALVASTAFFLHQAAAPPSETLLPGDPWYRRFPQIDWNSLFSFPLCAGALFLYAGQGFAFHGVRKAGLAVAVPVWMAVASVTVMVGRLLDPRSTATTTLDPSIWILSIALMAAGLVGISVSRYVAVIQWMMSEAEWASAVSGSGSGSGSAGHLTTTRHDEDASRHAAENDLLLEFPTYPMGTADDTPPAAPLDRSSPALAAAVTRARSNATTTATTANTANATTTSSSRISPLMRPRTEYFDAFPRPRSEYASSLASYTTAHTRLSLFSSGGGSPVKDPATTSTQEYYSPLLKEEYEPSVAPLPLCVQTDPMMDPALDYPVRILASPPATFLVRETLETPGNSRSHTFRSARSPTVAANPAAHTSTTANTSTITKATLSTTATWNPQLMVSTTAAYGYQGMNTAAAASPMYRPVDNHIAWEQEEERLQLFQAQFLSGIFASMLAGILFGMQWLHFGYFVVSQGGSSPPRYVPLARYAWNFGLASLALAVGLVLVHFLVRVVVGGYLWEWLRVHPIIHGLLLRRSLYDAPFYQLLPDSQADLETATLETARSDPFDVAAADPFHRYHRMRLQARKFQAFYRFWRHLRQSLLPGTWHGLLTFGAVGWTCWFLVRWPSTLDDNLNGYDYFGGDNYNGGDLDLKSLGAHSFPGWTSPWVTLLLVCLATLVGSIGWGVCYYRELMSFTRVSSSSDSSTNNSNNSNNINREILAQKATCIDCTPHLAPFHVPSSHVPQPPSRFTTAATNELNLAHAHEPLRMPMVRGSSTRRTHPLGCGLPGLLAAYIWAMLLVSLSMMTLTGWGLE